jgi:branched-chain amino acid transport system ATP-binding protein
VFFAGEDDHRTRAAADRARGISRSFQIMNLFNDYSARTTCSSRCPTCAAADSTAGATWPRTARRRTRRGRARARGPRGEGRDAGEEPLVRRAPRAGDRRRARGRAAALFLDEPTAGSARGHGRLADLIASSKERLTIVMIEHDMKFLFRLADRMSVIHWGR